MALTVFISYSTKDKELVDHLSYWLNQNGVYPYVAEYDPRPGLDLEDKLVQAINGSDVVVVLMTRNAELSDWVKYEVDQAMGMGKLVVPLVEEGVNPKGYLEGVEYIPFSRYYPYDAITRVIEHLSFLSARKADEERNRILIPLFIIVFGLLALAAADKRKLIAHG